MLYFQIAYKPSDLLHHKQVKRFRILGKLSYLEALQVLANTGALSLPPTRGTFSMQSDSITVSGIGGLLRSRGADHITVSAGVNTYVCNSNEYGVAVAPCSCGVAMTDGTCGTALCTEIRGTALAYSTGSSAIALKGHGSVAKAEGIRGVSVVIGSTPLPEDHATRPAYSVVTQPGSVAIALFGNYAKGPEGSTLVLGNVDRKGNIIVKVFPVDGRRIKEGVFYRIDRYGTLCKDSCSQLR